MRTGIKRTMLFAAPAAEGGSQAPSAAVPAAPASTPSAAGTPGDPLGEPGIKALQAERDARQKAEQESAKLRKQIEDSKKSAEQKAADDLAAATRATAEADARAASAALDVARFQAAAKHGVPLSMAGRIQGSTPEEIDADAKGLADLLGQGGPGKPWPMPAADRSQGGGAGSDKGASVSAGRELFATRHPAKP